MDVVGLLGGYGRSLVDLLGNQPPHDLNRCVMIGQSCQLTSACAHLGHESAECFGEDGMWLFGAHAETLAGMQAIRACTASWEMTSSSGQARLVSYMFCVPMSITGYHWALSRSIDQHGPSWSQSSFILISGRSTVRSWRGSR